MDWSKFFSMGGYAVYVWGSYGVAFVLLLGEVVMLWRRRRHVARQQSEATPAGETRLDTSFQGIQ